MLWLKRKLNVGYTIEGGGPRKEHWEIPETVFKEAIINALSHRDYYDRGAKIHIEVFDDRVEITNPGGLTSAINANEFGTKSHSRNPLIFGLFVRIHLVEQVGSGIGRMMDLMKKANLTPPSFKTDGLFTVILERKNIPFETENSTIPSSIDTVKSSGTSSGTKIKKPTSITWKTVVKKLDSLPELKIGKSAIKILELTYKNPYITIPELAEKISISERAIEKNIQQLRENNLLLREGSKTAGQWRLTLIN